MATDTSARPAYAPTGPGLYVMWCGLIVPIEGREARQKHNFYPDQYVWFSVYDTSLSLMWTKNGYYLTDGSLSKYDIVAPFPLRSEQEIRAAIERLVADSGEAGSLRCYELRAATNALLWVLREKREESDSPQTNNSIIHYLGASNSDVDQESVKP